MGRSLSCAIFLGAIATACNALTGVGDLTVESDAADASFEASSPSPISTTRADASAPAPDAGGLSMVDAAVVDGCSTTSCELLPADFQLVALGTPANECPSGFAQPVDVVESPTVGPGACKCECSVKDSPSCNLAAGSSIALTYSDPNTGTCALAGQAVPSGCSTEGFLGPFIAYDRNYAAPIATLAGGSCNKSTTKDDTKLKSTPMRLCQATVLPQCEGKTCPPVLTSFTTCVAALGDVACPAAWSKKHLVGTTASFTCGTDGCSCNVDGQCSTSGLLKYFPTANCSGAPGLSYPVGGCQTTAGSLAAFGSHRYDPSSPTNVKCQPGGSSAASTPALADPTTVCCR